VKVYLIDAQDDWHTLGVSPAGKLPQASGSRGISANARFEIGDFVEEEQCPMRELVVVFRGTGVTFHLKSPLTP